MKNRIGVLFALLLALVFPLYIQAQVTTERSKEITRIGGKDYYLHHVKQGETLFGLSKLYNVTEAQISTMNPEVQKGLKTGMVLGIPMVKEAPKPITTPPTSDKNLRHLVLKGETIYGISRQYEIGEKELIAMNPGIEEGLREGQVLVIPKKIVVAPTPTQPEKPQTSTTTSTNNNQTVVARHQDSIIDQTSYVIYIVKKGETLYDIAKQFGIDVKDFKVINHRLDNNPRAGTRIVVPDIVNKENYLVHKVERNQRTRSLLRLWKVDEDSFRPLNPFVGSRVYSGQNVLIPLPATRPHVAGRPTNEEPEDAVAEHSEQETIIPVTVTPECEADPNNAKQRFCVALLIPLYLDDANSIVVSKEVAERSRKARPFSFLQYYEGFMMAVDTLTNYCGLHLDLTVIDVDENVNKAYSAIEKLRRKNVDLIVGPFFSKSFSVVEEYARLQNIVMVNPLSERENVVNGSPNVIKLRPSNQSQMAQLGNLIRREYPNSKVTIIAEEKANPDIISELEHILNQSINLEVGVSNTDFLNFIAQESRRKEMGKQLLPTIEVEGQIYATNDMKARMNDTVFFKNRVDCFSYSSSGMNAFAKQLTGVRENVVVVYGNNIVFATQVLNKIHKMGNGYPITLIGLPHWPKFENLIVDNLMSLNAIYFNNSFVDFDNKSVQNFITIFREKYACEPKDYAFEGYDVGMYFLTALMRYGNQFGDCLPYYHQPLLHTSYYFSRPTDGNGMENYFWNIYQYDRKQVKLQPVELNKYIDK